MTSFRIVEHDGLDDFLTQVGSSPIGPIDVANPLRGAVDIKLQDWPVVYTLNNVDSTSYTSSSTRLLTNRRRLIASLTSFGFFQVKVNIVFLIGMMALSMRTTSTAVDIKKHLMTSSKN